MADEKDQQIADLEAKLAESESKRKILEEKVKWLSEENEECFVDGQKYNELREQKDKEIQELKQQLAEKEKEIESLKHFKVTIGTMETNQVDISSTTYTDQDKISFALEQLEKAKSFCISAEDNGWCVTHKNWLEIVEYIDNQIKAIKGE